MPEALPTRVGLLAAAVGGAIGSLARWGLAETWPPATTGGFPWTILLVNVVGSGALAALGLLPAARTRPWLAVLLGTGVCGGFTTMSTATVDGLRLLDAERWLAATGYVGGTLLGSLLAVALVLRLGGRS